MLSIFKTQVLEHKIALLCSILGIVLYVIRELMYQQTVTNLVNDVVWCGCQITWEVLR